MNRHHQEEDGQHRELGRPRSFADETVFAAVTRVVQAHSVARLTLAAVAKEIGCTGQALNARFGSRQGLLIAYADWTLERDVERFDRVRRTYPPGVAAIQARFLLPLQGREEEIADASGQLRMLSLIAEAQQDSEFAQRMKKRVSAFEFQLASMIRDAVAIGELDVARPEELAHMILILTVGAGVLSPSTADGSILDELRRILDCALAPYRVINHEELV